MPIAITLHTGTDAKEYLDAIATLRIEIFREYPYLYNGRFKDELGYLRHYAEAEGACLITVADNGVVVGAATGIPLDKEDRALKEPFADTIYPLPEMYYVGELLFYQAYRNKGLGMGLLSLLEQHVGSLGSYRYITCATVERPDEHPMRPPGYLPIDRFLNRTGFTKIPEITTAFTWLEIDGQKREHPMQFWMKELK